jgi:recombination protein RecA
MTLAALTLAAIQEKLGVSAAARAKTLPLHLSRPTDGEGAERTIDDALPDGGLPRGAVVEIASPRMLGRATTIALRACAAFQAEARLRSGDSSLRTPSRANATAGAWCAFIDPWSTLHAPAVAASGVDPTRLLVVRSPIEALSRVAVRVAESRIFGGVVVDTSSVPGSASSEVVRLDRWGTVVRRLSLAIERTDTTVVLLTDRAQPRAMPLPVALRLEVSSTLSRSIQLRVAKDRHGRVAAPALVSLR